MMHASTSLNTIEMLLSGALIDFDISQEEFTKSINEKFKYERLKQNEMKIVQETEVYILVQVLELDVKLFCTNFFFKFASNINVLKNK